MVQHNSLRRAFFGQSVSIELTAWLAFFVAIYFVMSFGQAVVPYGLIDEEIDYFFNSILRYEGEPAFIYRHPGTLIQNLGGLIWNLFGSPFEHEQGYLNLVRVIPLTALFLSVVLFYSWFRRRIGSLGCFVAIAIFLSFPGVVTFGVNFAAAAFVAPLGLILLSLVWTWPESRAPTRVVLIIGFVSGIALSIKFVFLSFLVLLWMALLVIALRRRGLGKTVLFTLYLVLFAAIGYVLAITPTYENAHFPFANFVKNFLVASKELVGASFIEKHVFLFREIPSYVVAPVGIVVPLWLIMLVHRIRGGGTIAFTRADVDRAIIVFFLAVGYVLSLNPQIQHVLTFDFRLALPFAALLPFLVVWPMEKLAGSGRQVGTRLRWSAYGLAMLTLLGSTVLYYRLDRAVIVEELAAMDSRRQQLSAQLGAGERVASYRYFTSVRAQHFFANNHQNAGGYFDDRLVELLPLEGYFIPHNLPAVIAEEERILRDTEARLVRIACRGATDEIKVRGGAFTQLLSFVGTSLLGDRCPDIVSFIASTDFNRGGNLSTMGGAVILGEQNGYAPDVLIYRSIAASGEDIKFDMDQLIMDSLEERYGIRRWKEVLINGEAVRLIWIGRDG